MTRFYPDKYLAQVLPKGFSEKGLLFDNLNPRKMYLRALYRVAGKEGKALQSTVYETIRTYQKKEEALQAAGVADYAQVAVNNQALLKSRVENFLIWNKVQEEKSAHSGQFYRWLPSDAEHPDPEHQLLYGKIFQVGKGDKDGNMPGERYGCRCGIEWLTDEEAYSLFTGKEFTGYKGQDAVKKLLKEEQGYIKNAFYRKEIGNIDLIWGNERAGLQHIILRRAKQGWTKEEFLKDFENVIKGGEIFKDKKFPNRINIWHAKYKKLAVIDKQYGKKKINWIITAFERKNRPTW